MITMAVADDFLTAYSRLPKQIQKAAREFTKKFRKNPKSPGSHYEPIANVREPRLKSVRVTQGYRAIVLAPDSGDVFVLLWIDNHDEAYRWAMDKRVEVHPTTGSLQLLSSVNLAELPSTPTRAAQPEVVLKGRFSDFSDEQLFHAGIPKPLLPAIRAIYSDSDLDAIVPHLPGEAAEVLTGLACGMTLDEAIEEALAKPVAKVGPVDVADVAAALGRPQSGRRFKVVDTDFDLDAALDAPLEKWRVFLHPAQQALVQRNYKGPTRVLGAAGTGKTVVAMHRAAWIVRNSLPADSQLLFTTFTVNLASDIENHLASLLSREEMNRVEVVGVDALATRILRNDLGQNVRLATGPDVIRAWREAVDGENDGDLPVDFFRAEWKDVVQAQGIETVDEYVKARRVGRGVKLKRSERRNVWYVFEAYRQLLAERGITDREEILRRARQAVEAKETQRYYQSIVVDETQDMSGEALRLIRALGRREPEPAMGENAVTEHENDLFFVGDAHQRIYGRPVTMSSCGINVRGRRSRSLRINYRTTDTIRRYAMSVLEGESFDDLDGGTDDAKGYVSLRSGPAPDVAQFDTLHDEQAFLVDSIKSLITQGVRPSHICITARTKELLTESYEPALAQAGIEVEILGRDSPKTDNLRMATMHRVKGLEYPVMFIAGVQAGIVPLSTADLESDDVAVARQALKQERCLFYVSATRARDRLFVSGHGARSEFMGGAA